MKSYIFAVVILLLALKSFAADKQLADGKIEENRRAPASLDVGKQVTSRILVNGQYEGSLIKVVDQESKTVCYWATKTSSDGGTALQCFKF